MVKKVLNLSILAGILLGVAPASLAMDAISEASSSMPEKISVTDSSGNKKKLSRDLIMASDNLSGAYAATIEHQIDLSQSSQSISTETLKLLDQLLQSTNKDTFLTPLTHDQIKSMYLAERYLGIESLRYHLVKHFQHRFPQAYGMEGCNQERKFSRTSLLSKGINPSITLGVLDLSNSDLQSLKGLEQLPLAQRNLVTALNVSNNPLSTLNLDKLLGLFPHLNLVNAQNCRLNKIKLNRSLPTGTCLFLAHNKLEHVPAQYFNAECCYIDLTHNRLSPAAIAEITEIIKPSLLQTKRAPALDMSYKVLRRYCTNALRIAHLVTFLTLGYYILKYACDLEKKSSNQIINEWASNTHLKFYPNTEWRSNSPEELVRWYKETIYKNPGKSDFYIKGSIRGYEFSQANKEFKKLKDDLYSTKNSIFIDGTLIFVSYLLLNFAIVLGNHLLFWNLRRTPYPYAARTTAGALQFLPYQAPVIKMEHQE